MLFTFRFGVIKRSALTLLAGLATAPFVAGCATSSRANSPPPRTAATTQPASEPTPVLRYGRYTLVELVAEGPQQNLLEQVVDITVPATLHASVGEALRYLLLRTGYQLCDQSDETSALEALPLPAAHIHLGPLRLRDALQVLAGPGWQLQVDDRSRRVCFASSPPLAHEASLSNTSSIKELHP